MVHALKAYWREIGVGLLAGYFFLRSLGTFPAAWTDDSLFMMVARQVANGEGYTFPILDHAWAYPYFLAIGPPLILPTAAAIKLFGFSVAVARIPMVLYLIGTTLAFAAFASKLSSRNTALWSLLLLVTLSPFVNSGKTVLGEVPGFFFLLLGLLCLFKPPTKKWTVLATVRLNLTWLAGVFFGLSVLTKLTYGLIYPALGCAWIAALFKRDRERWVQLTMTILIAIILFLPWRLLEMSSATGLWREFMFLLGAYKEGEEGWRILNGNYGVLLRPEFLYYGVMLLIGSFGLWSVRAKINRTLWITLLALIALFSLFFLSAFGWYRHLLPAHLLLIPFVVIAVQKFLHPKLAIALLLFFAIGQGWWQFTYRGSSRSTAATEAAAYVEEHLADADLIVEIPAIFVRLSSNPHWRFKPYRTLAAHLPQDFMKLSEQHRCMLLLRGPPGEDEEEFESRAQTRIARYVLIEPPSDCP